jgi:hypothetical protein
LPDEAAFPFRGLEALDPLDGFPEVGDEFGSVAVLGVGERRGAERVVGVVDLPADAEGFDAGGGVAPDRTGLGLVGRGAEGVDEPCGWVAFVAAEVVGGHAVEHATEPASFGLQGAEVGRIAELGELPVEAGGVLVDPGGTVDVAGQGRLQAGTLAARPVAEPRQPGGGILELGAVPGVPHPQGLLLLGELVQLPLQGAALVVDLAGVVELVGELLPAQRGLDRVVDIPVDQRRVRTRDAQPPRQADSRVLGGFGGVPAGVGTVGVGVCVLSSSV